jgi:ribonuclease HI
VRVTIIADASYCSQSGAAGYGYWTACERGKRGGGGEITAKVDSSGAAEMMAIVNAIHISVTGELVVQGDHVLLQTDCQAAIDAFLGNRNRLTNSEKAAKQAFFDLKRRVSFTFSFRHVKGHTSRPEARYVTNNLCDKRAKAGMRLARLRLADSQGSRSHEA